MNKENLKQMLDTAYELEGLLHLALNRNDVDPGMQILMQTKAYALADAAAAWHIDIPELEAYTLDDEEPMAEPVADATDAPDASPMLEIEDEMDDAIKAADTEGDEDPYGLPDDLDLNDDDAEEEVAESAEREEEEDACPFIDDEASDESSDDDDPEDEVPGDMDQDDYVTDDEDDDNEEDDDTDGDVSDDDAVIKIKIVTTKEKIGESDPKPALPESAPASTTPSDTSLASVHGDIRSLFSINDRFRFSREMFGGSAVDLTESLNVLAGLNTLAEAEDYLFNDLQLDPDSEDVKAFVGIISKFYA